MINAKEQQKAAKEFAKRWEGRGDEKQETQLFWIDLLQNVLSIDDPTSVIQFEKPVVVEKNTKFIDGYISSSKVLIEQKSAHIKLEKTASQSDGERLTPYGQAFRYNNFLPYEERPRWIIVSNFQRILIYNMNKPNSEPEEILLKDLAKQFHQLKFLVEEKSEFLKKEEQVSIDAGKLVGKLYDALIKQYKNPNDPQTLKSLNKLCVRLVFCLYAEDAGIFGQHEMFGQYLAQFQPKNVRKALIELFRVLDTKPEDRDPYMDDDLAAFPYVNGGLFADENIEIPRFTEEIVDLLIHNASEGFDWSEISPTIFGAVFESTLNRETRRSGGMHYTSIENIHKVIDPLFFDELKAELEEIAQIKVRKTRDQKLEAFREKLSTLVFLDPACGSGNFLTESYIALRKLENKSISIQYDNQQMFGEVINPVKVSIGQFYGIEINDFAVSVARTALWIAESQMLHETEELINQNIEFLPLKSYPNITEGNALRIDWESVVPKEKLSYIMGNPPFVGARLMGKAQKDDAKHVLGKWKNFGTLDFVSCWYKIAADYIKNTNICCAFVSTNSICQGEQATNLWKPLLSQGIHITFAYRTFQWDSEASLKAHVHCIIVGFTDIKNKSEITLYDNGIEKRVQNISGYLLASPSVFVENRKVPICNVPNMHNGCKLLDNGNYVLSEVEYLQIIKSDNFAEPFIKPYLGAKNFISGEKLYCIWLKGADPKAIKKSKTVIDRVKKVQEFRRSCSSPDTRKYADSPTLPTRLAYYSNNKETDMLVVPIVSSQRRKWLPIGYVNKNTIVSYSCMIIPDASLYILGIIESNVHIAWLKTVCGRMKSDYRYSNTIVYNNFPWCDPTPEQKAKIEQTAQAILDARAKYPDSSLADLYDEATMPSELRKAHQANDKAVMQAYGFWGKLNTESECVAELMKMYQKLTGK